MRVTCLGLVLCLWISAAAASLFGSKTSLRKFVILGNQTIDCPVNDNGPVSVENEDLKIEVTGLMMNIVNGGGSRLTPTYGFTAKKPLTFRKIVVEDVTGSFPVLLVADENPSLKNNYWKGDAASVLVSSENLPWLYANGDTWRVFRFTITTAERGEVVMLQPSFHSESTKIRLLAMVDLANREPSSAQLDRFAKSASQLIKGQADFSMVPILHKPSSGEIAGLVNTLKQTREKRMALTLASENPDWVFEILAGALAKAKKGQFKGQIVAVVVPGAETGRFLDLAASAGITIKVGPLVD